MNHRIWLQVQRAPQSIAWTHHYCGARVARLSLKDARTPLHNEHGLGGTGVASTRLRHVQHQPTSCTLEERHTIQLPRTAAARNSHNPDVQSRCDCWEGHRERAIAKLRHA